jgi:hypothetical protein
MLQGQVRFHKDKQGLLHMDLKKLSQEAVMMLLQKHTAVEVTKGISLIQTMQGNYKGFTRRRSFKRRRRIKSKQCWGTLTRRTIKDW